MSKIPFDMVAQDISITAFYRFIPLTEEEQHRLANSLRELAARTQLGGLVIVSPEGINGTVAGSRSAITEIKSHLPLTLGADIPWKDSFASCQPFRRFKVDLRPEIVSLKDTTVVPHGPRGHLSPAEWQKMLETRSDATVIDTRNFYETRVGKFRGAIDPGLRTFGEFPAYLKESEIPRDAPLLMYCTGGIRCEKAALVAERLGFSEVYQLDGGILHYLEEFPNSHFEGECFVFDNRVAVDQKLGPSARYRLCPHCGDPGETRIRCEECEAPTQICERCAESPERRSCSKNCAYHLRRRALAA